MPRYSKLSVFAVVTVVEYLRASMQPTRVERTPDLGGDVLLNKHTELQAEGVGYSGKKFYSLRLGMLFSGQTC
jgi:hypothetical protein